MFDALEMSLQFLERLVPFETRIRQRSASLAKQLADASESIALNLGEAGSGTAVTSVATSRWPPAARARSRSRYGSPSPSAT